MGEGQVPNCLSKVRLLLIAGAAPPHHREEGYTHAYTSGLNISAALPNIMALQRIAITGLGKIILKVFLVKYFSTKDTDTCY